MPLGWDEHERGVTRLRESYAALPVGAPVRLAKHTSNLFRGRPEPGTGLDVSGLRGVIEVDGDVAEVQGMCTYEHLVEATLAHGRIPLVVPQLKTITLGGEPAQLLEYSFLSPDGQMLRQLNCYRSLGRDRMLVLNASHLIGKRFDEARAGFLAIYNSLKIS